MSGSVDVTPDGSEPVDLSDLRALSLHELRVLWRRTFRRHPGPGLTRTLLVGMLAYQRQVDMHADLSPRHQAFIDRVIARMNEPKEGARKRPLVPPLPTNSMQPGTVLVREWNGKPEAVTVVEGGFLWAGSTYPTLSAVANAITGRHWNGWTFFGLKTPASRARSHTASSASDETIPKAVPEAPRRRGRPPKVRASLLQEVRP